MKVTTKEAAEKWCPENKGLRRISSVGYGEPPLLPGEHVLESPAGCIGPRCMFWRWSDLMTAPGFIRYTVDIYRQGPEPETVHPEGGDPKPARIAYDVPIHYEWSPSDGDPCDPTPAGWSESTHLAELRRRGFCGKAGDPDLGDLLREMRGEMAALR